MRVTVTAQTPIHHDNRLHAEKRLTERLGQYPQIENVSLVLTREAHRVDEWSAVARVELRHGTLHIRQHAHELPQVVEQLVDTLDCRLAQRKQRMTAHKGHSSVRTMDVGRTFAGL